MMIKNYPIRTPLIFIAKSYFYRIEREHHKIDFSIPLVKALVKHSLNL